MGSVYLYGWRFRVLRLQVAHDVFVGDALLGDIFMTHWNWQYGLSLQLSVFALASSALLLHCQLFTGTH